MSHGISSNMHVNIKGSMQKSIVSHCDSKGLTNPTTNKLLDKNFTPKIAQLPKDNAFFFEKKQITPQSINTLDKNLTPVTSNLMPK